MASDPHHKNRMQVFKNKGKDQDVSIASAPARLRARFPARPPKKRAAQPLTPEVKCTREKCRANGLTRPPSCLVPAGDAEAQERGHRRAQEEQEGGDPAEEAERPDHRLHRRGWHREVHVEC